MYWVDFNFVKIVEDRLVISIDVPVVAQRAEESVLTVVSSRQDALWEVHDPLLQKVIRGIQTTHKFWGEGESLGSAWHSRDGWLPLTNMSAQQLGPHVTAKVLTFFQEKKWHADLTVPETRSPLEGLQYLFSFPPFPPTLFL